MTQRTLSNPTVEVNDDTIAMVPNSLEFVLGLGTKTIKGQSSGGNGIEVVITEDAETKISTMKFKLYVTKKNHQLVKDWQVLDSSTINLSEGDFSEAFRDMAVTNDPPRAIGADGMIEIEWAGAPSV